MALLSFCHGSQSSCFKSVFFIFFVCDFCLFCVCGYDFFVCVLEMEEGGKGVIKGVGGK